ncbi:hypothetical protein BDR06DRAFT_973933 [Suillus hirtellus]|nr:hypothetical protein BDR06DRAFT_973933 [Suillus hirtellus]
MAISKQNIPQLQQIINVELHNGTSVWEIVNKLEDALEVVDNFSLHSIKASVFPPFALFAPGPHLPHSLPLLALFAMNSLMKIFACVSLMVDEIALEEMAVHFSKYNKIAGLCWKHSHLINPVHHMYKSAITIAQKFHDGEVHLGKELMVIGVTCFREDKLHPVLVAPTCKTENAGDMEITLTHAIEWWNRTGAAALVRPVWSFATDGDAMHHAAGHKLFLKKLLLPESPLYSILNNMPGLNTMTGDAKVMLDCDLKHIFKCFCMLIHSTARIILNNGHVINSMMLSRYLVWLPTYDKASITKLLHSDDPQDILQAIESMQAINVIFNTTKQQLLDPYKSFFLGDCGDDRLELMFSQLHMISGHNSGCSYSQALDCLGAAKDINDMFNWHPELNPGHQCLSLGKWIEDVDHINQMMWRGDTISGHCDLPSAWQQGHEIALSILTTSQINPINYSFANLFHDSGTNILCPLGNNKYFGIAEEELDDSSRVPNPPPVVPATLPSHAIEMVIATDENEEELMLTFEEELIAQSISDIPPTQPHPLPTVPSALQGAGICTNDYLLYKDSTECVVIISIPGFLVEPINPEPTFIRLWDDVNSDNCLEIKGGQSTWQVLHAALLAICELLWTKVVKAKIHLKFIACLPDGTSAVVSIEASNLLAASEGKWITICSLCEAKVTDMHSHIGQHILCALSNMPKSLKEQVGKVLPCRFCGQSGLPECTIQIKVFANGPPSLEMKCINHFVFKYKFADQGLKNTPCRNVPIRCTLCHLVLPPEPGKSTCKIISTFVDAVWRYNMAEYVLSQHEEYSMPGRREAGVPLPAEVWEIMKLTDLEQTTTQIPKEHW